MTMNNVVDKKYYNEINIARGIALIFVTLGHSLSMTHMPDAAVWLYNFCYSFHMGLFIFLSGFLSKKYLLEKVDVPHEIIKKVKRLMIPYCIFSVLTLFIKMAGGAIAEWNKSLLLGFLLGASINESLWYLWTLFVITIIIILMCNLMLKISVRKKCGILFVIAIGCYCLFEMLEFPYGLGNMFKYMIFYVLGMWMAIYYSDIKFYLQKARILLIVAEAVFIILISTNLDVWYIITALLGIYVIMGISLKITAKENILYRILMCFGNYAYEVYLISYFVQTGIRQIGEKIVLSYWFIMFIMFSVSLLVPIWISKYIIRKNRILMAIFGL